MILKIAKTSAFLLLIFSFVFLLIYLPRLIKIGKIDCNTQYGKCEVDLLGKLSLFEGENLHDARKGAETYLKEQSFIKKYSMHYQMPQRLDIDIIEERPEFAVKPKDAQAFFLVGQSGKVLSVKDSTNLPYLEKGESLPQIGDSVDEREKFALSLLKDLHLFFDVNSAVLEKDYMKASLSDNETLLLPIQGDKQVLIGSISLISSRLNIENGDSKINNSELIEICAISCEIDLRYKNAIVRKTN